jgi:hypothetical protein
MPMQHLWSVSTSGEFDLRDLGECDVAGQPLVETQWTDGRSGKKGDGG